MRERVRRGWDKLTSRFTTPPPAPNSTVKICPFNSEYCTFIANEEGGILEKLEPLQCTDGRALALPLFIFYMGLIFMLGVAKPSFTFFHAQVHLLETSVSKAFGGFCVASLTIISYSLRRRSAARVLHIINMAYAFGLMVYHVWVFTR